MSNFTISYITLKIMTECYSVEGHDGEAKAIRTLIRQNIFANNESFSCNIVWSWLSEISATLKKNKNKKETEVCLTP